MFGQLCNDRPAFREHLGTGRPVDRTVHAPAAEKSWVRRVHDHVDVGFGDVPEHGTQLHLPDRRVSDMTAPALPLRRDIQHKVIAGVCAGIARRYGLSRSGLRLAFVLSCVLPGPQFVAYLLLWVLIPAD